MLGAVAACATSSSSPPKKGDTTNGATASPSATRRPRPIRRPGQPAGQAELQAAIAAANAEDLTLALAKSREAIQKNPNLEQAYLLAGSICGIQGQLECEQESYEAGLVALPKSSALLRERATLHLQQGEVAEAVAKYEEANRLTGHKSPEVLAELAYAYVYVDRLDEAKTLADRAVQLDARCFPCRMAAGQVNLSKKNFPAAIASYEAARNLQPDDPDAARSEAKARFLDGQLDAASSMYEALVKASPDDGRLRVQAAQVAMKAGRFQDAVGHLKVVAAANPTQKKLLEFLAQAQTKAGDSAGAKATLRKASQLK